MKTLRIQLGDVYADGHGMYEDVPVNVPEHLSIEDLRHNFDKNVAEIGVDPRHFCRDYEDSTITQSALTDLSASGFSFSDSAECYVDGDSVYLDVESYTEILMFFYGHGFDGFEWSIAQKPPVLNQSSFGYGLFSL